MAVEAVKQGWTYLDVCMDVLPFLDKGVNLLLVTSRGVRAQPLDLSLEKEFLGHQVLD